MKLTIKDKDFLVRLKALFDSKDLEVDLKKDGLKRLVLRRNYGDKIETEFNMTRQGVRWRFQRIFSNIYVESYEAIYLIESLFSTELRQKAMEIVRERVELRKKDREMSNFELYRRENN